MLGSGCSPFNLESLKSMGIFTTFKMPAPYTLVDVDSIIHWSCSSNSTMLGFPETICQNNGFYNNFPPTCGCSLPPKFTNAKLVMDKGQIRIKCHEGFGLKETIMICLNGTWFPNVTSCLKICKSNPRDLENPTMKLKDDPKTVYFEGDLIDIPCKNSEITGVSTWVCKNGNWNKTSPCMRVSIFANSIFTGCQEPTIKFAKFREKKVFSSGEAPLSNRLEAVLSDIQKPFSNKSSDTFKKKSKRSEKYIIWDDEDPCKMLEINDEPFSITILDKFYEHMDKRRKYDHLRHFLFKRYQQDAKVNFKESNSSRNKFIKDFFRVMCLNLKTFDINENKGPHPFLLWINESKIFHLLKKRQAGRNRSPKPNFSLNPTTSMSSHLKGKNYSIKHKEDDNSVSLGEGQKNPTSESNKVYRVGFQLQATCLSTRKLEGSSNIIKCQENGLWEPLINCDSCLNRKLRDASVIGIRNDRANTYLANNCKEGHPTQIYDPQCSESGYGDPCGDGCYVPKIEYGNINYTIGNQNISSGLYPIGTIINVVCSPGHSPGNLIIAKCLSKGWTELPKCSKGCGFLSNQLEDLIDIQDNSKVHDSYPMNSKIVVRCPPDMLLLGKPDLKCVNGTWDDSTKCISKPNNFVYVTIGVIILFIVLVVTAICLYIYFTKFRHSEDIDKKEDSSYSSYEPEVKKLSPGPENSEYLPSDSSAGLYHYAHFEFVRPIFDKMEQSDFDGTTEDTNYTNIQSYNILKDIPEPMDKNGDTNIQGKKSAEEKATGVKSQSVDL
ncbi:unnamed protein product [Gordionus sp. m RMFG-2023]